MVGEVQLLVLEAGVISLGRGFLEAGVAGRDGYVGEVSEIVHQVLSEAAALHINYFISR